VSDTLRQRLIAAAGDRWQDQLADPDPAVRRTALLSAARLAGDAELADTVTAALGDPAPLVRREGAEIAGRRPAVARQLLGRLGAMLRGDSDEHCRESAAFALGESGDPRGAEPLAAVLDSERSPLVREAVAGALGALGAEDTLPLVIGLTRGEKPAVRRRAVVALAAFDDPSADAAIEAALADRDRFVREAAEWLLREDP